MKTLIILFHLIKSHILKNKTMVAVFLFIGLLFGICLFVTIGAFTNFMANRGTDDLLECKYVVAYNQPIEREKLAEYDNNVFYRKKKYFEMHTRLETSDGVYSISTVYPENAEICFHGIQNGKGCFSESDLKNGPIAIVGTAMNKNVGENVEVPGIGSFLVVGVFASFNSKDIYIPSSYFEKADFKIDQIVFCTNRKLSLFETKNLNSDLLKIEGSIINQGYEGAAMSAYSSDILAIALLAVVILAVFFFILNYTSKKGRFFYSLIGMLGSSKENTLFLLVFEKVMITTALMAASVFVHLGIRGPVHKLLGLAPCGMNFWDYAVTVLIIVLVAVISGIPYSTYYIRHSYTKTMKHYE